MKICISALLTFFVLTAPAFAVSINSPSNGDTVTSPFTLSASAATCSSQSVRTLGYSLDSGSDIENIHQQEINVKVSSGTGTHTVHVKAWGDKGAVCVTDIKVKVESGDDGDGGDGGGIAPSDAVSVSNIQSLKGWNGKHDSGTNGSSSGKTNMVGSPSHTGATREFKTTFKSRAGERYSVTFGENQSATHFLYDAWVYIKSPSTHIANLELDVNQTMPSGDTVIFGVQCDGYSGRWAYATNQGTAKNPKGKWVSSSASCNPRKWTTGKWHHVQAEYSRTSGGHITYKAVWLDGKKSNINKTAFGARSMGWGSSLSTNFQVDGVSSGTATLYLDDLKIYRW